RNKAGTNTAFATPHVVPDSDAIARAAEILGSGRKVAILAGRGAVHARVELRALADLLGAPIAKALLGKDVLPDDDPLVTGGVGYLGARPSQQMFAECDTLLIVGSSFPYVEYYPDPAKGRNVQIDLYETRIEL